MCPLAYYTVLRQSKGPTYLRLEMVRYAREQGIKPAARYFHTTIGRLLLTLTSLIETRQLDCES
jgi:hypothetical protein